jgi:hypothetical protein
VKRCTPKLEVKEEAADRSYRKGEELQTGVAGQARSCRQELHDK